MSTNPSSGFESGRWRRGYGSVTSDKRLYLNNFGIQIINRIYPVVFHISKLSFGNNLSVDTEKEDGSV